MWAERYAVYFADVVGATVDLNLFSFHDLYEWLFLLTAGQNTFEQLF